MRLIDTPIAGESRAEFFALAAKAMRSILVDHARGKARAKRGAGAAKVSLDEAMEQLAELDARKAEIVEACLVVGDNPHDFYRAQTEV